jgi:hypothetical protein
VRLSGRGTFNFYTKFDYTLGQGLFNQGNIVSANVAIYNSSVYNDTNAIYGPSFYEAFQDFNSQGFGKVIAFQFTQTGTTSSTAPPLLIDGASPEVGAFAIYGIQSLYMPLGIS